MAFAASDVIYCYDGSYDGLMCCIFESFLRKERPADHRIGDRDQPSLFPVREIVTDPVRAARVKAAIPARAGSTAMAMVQRGFLYGGAGKERAIADFLQLAFEVGSKACQMTDRSEAAPLFEMARAVENERHRLLGFLRFSDIGGVLVAVIEPKHCVLPLLRTHFCGRYPEERLLIHDAARQLALVYRPYEHRWLTQFSFEPASPDEAELQFRRLWQGFYRAVGIDERSNPRCRMNHMPKRFWESLTEMQGETAALPSKRSDGRLSGEAALLSGSESLQ